MKKKLWIAFITTLVLIALTVGLVIMELNRSVFSNTISNETGETLYRLPNSATDYQKELFRNLASQMKLKDNEKNIAAAIVQNYVADFYTWTNKKGSYDIGGMQYVYQPEILNIYTFAKDYFYRDLSYYIQTLGNNPLLEVEEVIINFADYNQEVEYNGEIYETIYVAAEWKYRPTSDFDISAYQTKGAFSLVIREDRIDIYRYYEGE